MSTPNKLRLLKEPRQSKHIAGGEDGQRDICADRHGNFPSKRTFNAYLRFHRDRGSAPFQRPLRQQAKLVLTATRRPRSRAAPDASLRWRIGVANFSTEACAARLDAHAESKLDPIKFGIMHIEHRKGLGPGTAGSDARKVDVEDRENIVKAMLERQ
jgi:hypothetical protein